MIRPHMFICGVFPSYFPAAGSPFVETKELAATSAAAAALAASALFIIFCS
jgi:hypothetical protein